MDPLSIIGLVELGIGVISKVYGTIRDGKHAKEEIEHLKICLDQARKVLEFIKDNQGKLCVCVCVF